MNLLAQAHFPTHPLFIIDHPLFWLLIMIDVVLRGFALYKAARNNSPLWFVALLVVNSVGILPIIYLVFFSKNLQISPSTSAAAPNQRATIQG